MTNLVEGGLQSDGLHQGVTDGDAACLRLVQRVQQLLVLQDTAFRIRQFLNNTVKTEQSKSKPDI